MDEIRISDKLQAKIEKHYAITRTLFDHYSVIRPLDGSLIEYARYVLTRGTFSEQHALAKGIQQKLRIKNGQLAFTESSHYLALICYSKK